MNMRTFNVVFDENIKSHVVLGLESEDGRLSYLYPDWTTTGVMKDKRMMFIALHDMFQLSNELNVGDIIKTEFGDFICAGMSVEAMALPHEMTAEYRTKASNMTKEEERERLAQLNSKNDD